MSGDSEIYTRKNNPALVKQQLSGYEEFAQVEINELKREKKIPVRLTIIHRERNALAFVTIHSHEEI